MIRNDRRLTLHAPFFVPQLQRALEVVAVVALIGMIVFPLGWGYAQRQQARVWQETACAYRLREVARETSALVRGDGRGGACGALRELGLAGLFLVLAAIQLRPQDAQGLGGTLRTIRYQHEGRLLLGIIALGFISNGILELVRARYREIRIT